MQPPLLPGGRRERDRGLPGQIKAAQPGSLLELRLAPADTQPASDLLKRQFAPWRVSIFADRLHLVVEDPERETPLLRQRLSVERLIATDPDRPERRVPLAQPGVAVGAGDARRR